MFPFRVIDYNFIQIRVIFNNFFCIWSDKD